MSEQNLPWRKAIIAVLKEAKEALHYRDITERIIVRELRTKLGATPESTVNADISGSIKKDGEKSVFMRVSEGVYLLREQQSTANQIKQVEEDASDSTMLSFGMYWRRDQILWNKKPTLPGKQLANAKEINFSDQIGVYILYDNHVVVYVGRATERPLGLRLFEHTIDRLSGRWDRFSWFGMYAANDDGTLRYVEVKPTPQTLISSLEALLIETLEPPQNRRRGDGLNAIEYIQAEDPNLKAQRDKELLTLIQKKLIS